MKIRKNMETRRRSRRLAPGVLGLCLVMILASSLTLVAAPAAASPVQGAYNQSSGPSAAGNNSTGPLIIPGTYVTFTCTHGTISLNGTQECSHTTVEHDLCDSSTCQWVMKGTVDSGYTFYGWQLSGQASVSCGSCLSTTLTVHTPNSGDVYAASVTLDTTAPPPPPTETITVYTFENWSSTPPWVPAEVKACLDGTCSTASNGQTLVLYQGDLYTVTAINLQLSETVLEWSTNAGQLSSSQGNPTTFDPTESGSLTLITNLSASWAGYVYSPSSNPFIPSGQPPASNCFGGGSCTGPDGTRDGSGTTCVISGFSEAAGDFMYVAINYLASTNIITSVSDGGIDTFAYNGGEFGGSGVYSESVALYDVASEHGGAVTITVTISATEFGTCRVGQLSAGTTVGVVGNGGSASSSTDTSLSVSNSATHEPSLLMALFGSNRPSGPWQSPLPKGSWIDGGDSLTGYNPGTNSELIAYNDTASGTVTFTETLGNTGYDICLSAIVVEFYLKASGSGISSVSGEFTLPNLPTNSTGVGFGVWLGFGGLFIRGQVRAPLWQAGVSFSPATGYAAFFESIPGPTSYSSSLHIQPRDRIDVTIASNGKTSTFSVQDLSRVHQPVWSGNNSSFVPNLLSGEWMVEPNATGNGNETNFTYMAVNGVALTLPNSLIGYTFLLKGEGSPWYVTPLAVGSSSTVFSVLPP